MSLFSVMYGSRRPENEKQAHPKGIRLFFSIIKWHWARLIGLNVLFILTCLPIVTIPCSMSALSRVLGTMLQRKICYPWHDYWHEFIGDWKRSSLCGLVLWSVCVATVLGAGFYLRMHASVGTLLAAICMLMALFSCAMMMFAFVLCAFTDLKVGQILRNSMILTQMSLVRMLFALGVIALLLILTYLLLPWSVFVMPLFGFVLIGLIGVFSTWDIVCEYVIDEKQKSSGKENVEKGK